jgi:hypothetical protein
MTEQKEQIPQDLADAFHQVVWRYADWQPPNPEIEVKLRRQYHSMSVVCSLVVSFDDPLPEDVFDQLYGYLHAQHRELKERLGKGSTYSAGSYCLFRLIDERKAEYAMRMWTH